MRATSIPTLLLLGSLLSACGADFSSTMEDHARRTGLVYKPCGEVAAGQCSTWRPDAQTSTALDCLRQGFTACSPARLVQTRPTVEGDPIREAIFIEGLDDQRRCRLTFISDTTDDRFGPRMIETRTCLELAALEACGGVLQPTQCATP